MTPTQPIGQAIRGFRRFEWPTITLAALCYGIWAGAGFYVWPVAPAAALALMGVMVAFHSSLQHEALHGHPTANATVNEAFVFLPLGLYIPFRRYKALHLRHHRDERLTDPYDDPESYYRAEGDHGGYSRLFKTILALNNTLIGRLAFGPWLMMAGFLREDWRALRAGNRDVRRAWLLHGLGAAPVIVTIQYGFGIPLLLYIVTSVYLGLALISIRTYAEHQWAEDADGRTIIVERSLLSLLFLNNNLHFIHHKMPTVAWYRLPALYRARRREWIEANGGYVLPNYLAMMAAFAFRAKEPVVHPFLRRAEDTRAAFAPRVRAHNVGSDTGQPVPARHASD